MSYYHHLKYKWCNLSGVDWKLMVHLYKYFPPSISLCFKNCTIKPFSIPSMSITSFCSFSFLNQLFCINCRWFYFLMNQTSKKQYFLSFLWWYLSIYLSFEISLRDIGLHPDTIEVKGKKGEKGKNNTKTLSRNCVDVNSW